MSEIVVTAYTPDRRSEVIELSVKAWQPVFPQTEGEVPGFVMQAFYPDGWQVRQVREVGELLDNEPQNIWLACQGETVAGFLGLRLHPEDQMGEIYIIAVSPEYQRQGISTKLMRFAEAHIREAGMKMIMVETVGDTGHAPARRAYEAFGFERWPVARYFKEL